MERLPFGNIAIPEAQKERIRQSLDSGHCSDPAQMWAEAYNKSVGKLEGYDCKECLNRGNYAKAVDGMLVTCLCRCLKIRSSLKRIEQSGLKDTLDIHTFGRYKAVEPWQKYAKERAVAYSNNSQGHWFFMGGQVGSGKTHLCTAIVGQLLKQGKSARYMMWRDESIALKCNINEPHYKDMIEPFKRSDVLYIDDLFKGFRDDKGVMKAPTPADLAIAFEILNYRYQNPKLATIISTEYIPDDLFDMDEAIGSRICQLAAEFTIMIDHNESRNYRILPQIYAQGKDEDFYAPREFYHNGVETGNLQP